VKKRKRRSKEIRTGANRDNGEDERANSLTARAAGDHVPLGIPYASIRRRIQWDVFYSGRAEFIRPIFSFFVPLWLKSRNNHTTTQLIFPHKDYEKREARNIPNRRKRR
jgi:hypothetical protein